MPNNNRIQKPRKQPQKTCASVVAVFNMKHDAFLLLIVEFEAPARALLESTLLGHRAKHNQQN